MIIWRSLPVWILRAWPVLAPLPLFGFHAIALDAFSTSAPMVNKLVGMALQVIGGILILYSIDQNLGLFGNQSLFKKLTAYVRSFPITRKTVVLCGTGVASASGSASASISTRKAPTTLEERVAELEHQLQEVRANVNGRIATIHTRIDEESKRLSGRIDESTHEVRKLTGQIHESAVGGFKLQVFGVLLVIYGAVTSVYA